jgi:biopolymer transport protein ExbD
MASSSNAFTALNVGVEEDEQAMSAINTTPLVDVMLVLLIVFMITVPVVTHTVPLEMPDVENIATETKPENITIAVNREGQVFWNGGLVADNEALLAKFKDIATQTPQPEVHVRADRATRYENVGRVILSAQRMSIMKVGFITEPHGKGGR